MGDARNNNEMVQEEPGKSGRHIDLHPLAIVSICDHCTRVKVGGSQQSADSRILGILFGVQDGLRVSITDAFELQYEEIEGNIKIPAAYVNEKKELYSAVNQHSEVMGWYSVGTDISPGDLEIHRAMSEWNESPIFLLLNPKEKGEGGSKDKQLPMSLYESELHVVDEIPTMLFVPVPFQLEAAEAERISVEHVVKETPSMEEGVSFVDQHVHSINNSLQALIARLKTCVNLLEATAQGQIPPDYRLLRHIGNICNQLPTANSEEFSRAFLKEYNDSLLVTYLASLSKLSCLSNEVTEKYSVAFGNALDRHPPPPPSAARPRRQQS